jgi:hypothetical protein
MMPVLRLCGKSALRALQALLVVVKDEQANLEKVIATGG